MVSIKNLMKVYHDRKKDVTALSNVSFELRTGEICGLLGVNGAGKTTALRILATMLKPSSGTVTVGGYDTVTEPEKVRNIIGFMTSSTSLYPRLTGREILRYFGRLHGMSEDEIANRIEQLIQEFGLSDFIDRKCDKLSTGQKQRVSVARTSLHRPSLLVLDEPTSGLDVLGAKTLVDFVRRSKSQGQTVLFSTHRMEEAQSLCDRIVVIHQGRVMADGTLPVLCDQFGKTDLQDLFLKIIGE